MLNLRPLPLLPFLIVVAITFISLTTLYSVSGGNFTPWCIKQIWRILLGFLVLIAVSNVKISVWRKYGMVLYCVCLLALIAVAVTGKITMGAQRWLRIGTLTIQPSELMRISLIIVLAKYFSTTTINANRHTATLLVPTLMTAIPVGFVLLQPDLGTAMLLILTFLSILFVCGVQIWKFIVLFVSVLVCTPILWNFLYDYQRQRILMLLRPEIDPSGAGYHIIQAKIALGSGGFWGKGLANCTQSQLNFLPEKHNDFIFAALGEEFGFVGCVILLFLYVLLLIFNFKVAISLRQNFSRIIVFGLNSMIFLYIVINVFMVCGLLPVVGIPLPFFSYGGNSLTVLMFCQGVIFASFTESQSYNSGCKKLRVHRAPASH